MYELNFKLNTLLMTYSTNEKKLSSYHGEITTKSKPKTEDQARESEGQKVWCSGECFARSVFVAR